MFLFYVFQHVPLPYITSEQGLLLILAWQWTPSWPICVCIAKFLFNCSEQAHNVNLNAQSWRYNKLLLTMLLLQQLICTLKFCPFELYEGKYCIGFLLDMQYSIVGFDTLVIYSANAFRSGKRRYQASECMSWHFFPPNCAKLVWIFGVIFF
jgi:hypothetical protein